MKDEREGQLSASALEAAALCPGKPAAERGLPDEESAIAVAGTRMHKAFEVGCLHGLQPDEREIVMRADAQLSELIENWESRFEPDMFPDQVTQKHLREERVWGFDRRLSGKYDGLKIHGTLGLLYDLKTGYAAAMEATRNFQLRALAVLAAKEYGLKQVTVAIIQPNLFPPSVSECVYGEDDLARSEQEIDAIITRAADPEARRIPGPVQCKYCRAKSSCPEAIAATSELAKISPDAITVERLPGLLEACEMADKNNKAIRAKARQELEASEDAVPGWKLKTGARIETIVDPEGLFQRLHIETQLTAEQFVSICNVSKTKLKALIKETTGLKGKALAEFEAKVLDGLTEGKRKAASLAREVKP